MFARPKRQPVEYLPVALAPRSGSYHALNNRRASRSRPACIFLESRPYRQQARWLASPWPHADCGISIMTFNRRRKSAGRYRLRNRTLSLRPLVVFDFVIYMLRRRCRKPRRLPPCRAAAVVRLRRRAAFRSKCEGSSDGDQPAWR